MVLFPEPSVNQTLHEILGRICGEGAGGATPPEMTCGFLIQLVFCKKKKKDYVVYWC